MNEDGAALMATLRVGVGIVMLGSVGLLMVSIGWLVARLLHRLSGSEPEGFFLDGIVGLIALAIAVLVVAAVWQLGGWAFTLLPAH